MTHYIEPISTQSLANAFISKFFNIIKLLIIFKDHKNQLPSGIQGLFVAKKKKNILRLNIRPNLTPCDDQKKKKIRLNQKLKIKSHVQKVKVL